MIREIAKGGGRFSLDPLTHASNTIEDMKAIAEATPRPARRGGEMPERIDAKVVLADMRATKRKRDLQGESPAIMTIPFNRLSRWIAALAQEIADREALWQRCHIVYWPTGRALAYPIEHNLAAKKDNRRAVEAALREEER